MGKDGLTPFGNALAGAIGGVVSNSIVYPLDTVKTRIQAEAKQAAVSSPVTLPSPQIKRQNAPARLPAMKLSARKVIQQILREQGFEGFYRGFLASMLNTFSMQFAYFYWYTIVRGAYIKRFNTRLPGASNASPKIGTATELSLGALAGAIAQIFTIPVSVVATRQQLDSSTTGGKSLLGTVAEIIEDDGITGLWRGLKPSLVLTVNPAITYGMFERLKSAILGPEGKMTPWKAFCLGAMSKTIATIFTYPYIMAKVRLQAKYVDDEDLEVGNDPGSSSRPAKKKKRYSGAIDVLQKVYAKNGFAGWYQGMQAQITKAVLSQALLFGIKDILENYTVLLLIFISKLHGSPLGVANEVAKV